MTTSPHTLDQKILKICKTLVSNGAKIGCHNFDEPDHGEAEAVTKLLSLIKTVGTKVIGSEPEEDCQGWATHERIGLRASQRQALEDIISGKIQL